MPVSVNIIEKKDRTNEIETLTRSDCRYLLKCKHCIGLSEMRYTMPCVPLKRTKSGKVKILVFGDRYWNHRKDKKQVRYVPAWRIKPISAFDVVR